jgi:hypothetical protein
MEPIVTRFVDVALEDLRRADLLRLPDPTLPTEMRDGSVARTDDWIPWKPIPSTVTESDLDELERGLGLRYPPRYRQFLRYKHFAHLDCALMRFVDHPVHRWRDELRGAYRAWAPERIVGIGLIPFGDEGLMDAGPVCFDTRDRLPDGDSPVVFWDHEWVGSEREIQPMFSSGAAMFRCLTFAIESGVNPVCHTQGANDATLLARKHRALGQFLALDPAGAGSAAREYWTCWGVDPG